MKIIYLQTICTSIDYGYLLREPHATFFETPSNQGKNNETRIAVIGVYFASYDFVCEEDTLFQIKINDIMICRRNGFLRTVAVDDINPLHL